ncbi:hypothetical protein GF325_12200 [Candidatus Bathyarchaeota archaeon]|nr:hypothetical protein [Candidatus Bathyarchaeota archaeon]
MLSGKINLGSSPLFLVGESGVNLPSITLESLHGAQGVDGFNGGFQDGMAATYAQITDGNRADGRFVGDVDGAFHRRVPRRVVHLRQRVGESISLLGFAAVPWNSHGMMHPFPSMYAAKASRYRVKSPRVWYAWPVPSTIFITEITILFFSYLEKHEVYPIELIRIDLN